MKKNNHQLTFYIAHTFSLRFWVRDVLCPELHRIGVKTINPFYNPDGSFRKDRPEVKLLDEGKMTHKDIPEEVRETIVPKDLMRIRKGKSGIIAVLKQPSVGTCMEIFYCSNNLKRNVYLITENNKLFYHPWLMYYCRKIFKSRKALYAYLKELMREMK